MTIPELKREAHRLIDVLVGLGVRRDSVYVQLRSRLGRKNDKTAGHLRFATSHYECTTIVNCLNRMIDQKKLRIKRKEFLETLALEREKMLDEALDSIILETPPTPTISRWDRIRFWFYDMIHGVD